MIIGNEHCRLNKIILKSNFGGIYVCGCVYVCICICLYVHVHVLVCM